MVQSKTRKQKRKLRGGTAMPNAPKKQRPSSGYNLRPNHTVKQLINIFEPITPLNIQEGIQPIQQANNAKYQPTYNIQQQLGKVRHWRKNTVTQQTLKRPPKQQAQLTLQAHKKSNQPQLFMTKKAHTLQPLTGHEVKYRSNLWETVNNEEPN